MWHTLHFAVTTTWTICCKACHEPLFTGLTVFYVRKIIFVPVVIGFNFSYLLHVLMGFYVQKINTASNIFTFWAGVYFDVMLLRTNLDSYFFNFLQSISVDTLIIEIIIDVFFLWQKCEGDISIVDVRCVPSDFHARFKALERT